MKRLFTWLVVLLLVVPMASAQSRKRNKTKRLPEGIEYSSRYAVLPAHLSLVEKQIEIPGAPVNAVRFGAVDTLCNMVIEPIYSELISYHKSGYAIVTRDGKRGLLDMSCREFIPCEWTQVFIPYDNRIRVQVGNGKNKRFGFLNMNGEQVIAPVLEGATNYNNGIAAVRQDGKWGHIDTLGRIITPLQYDDAQNFVNGYAAVGVQGKYYMKYGFVDLSGTLVIPTDYYSVSAFVNGRAVVSRIINGAPRYGAIDTTGALVLPIEWDYVSSFRYHSTWVGKGVYPNCVYTLLDENGTRLISTDLYDLNDSGGGGRYASAGVRIGDGTLRYGVVSHRGRVILPFRYERITLFTENLADGSQALRVMGLLNGKDVSLELRFED